MNKRKCHRIVRDMYSGFEVQEKRKFLWWSWWVQLGYTKGQHVNTFSSLELAKDWIKSGCIKVPKEQPSNVLWISEGCK